MSSIPKPGERKILQALAIGDKPFKDLRDECVRNPNILSSYLKNLQKHGLIIRDIDTRKFKLIGRGWETLYLADIRDLIEEYGLKKMSMKLLWGLDVIVSEDTDILKVIDKTLGEPRARTVRLSFSRINQFLFHTWKKRTLDLLSPKEKKTIGQYEDALEEAIGLTISPEDRSSKESSRVLAEQKLRRRYPGVEIPEKIIQLEAARITKKSEERARRAMTLELGTAENTRKHLLSAIPLTDEDQGRLKTLTEYLEEPKNIEVHKKYLSKLRECPKTLIVFSSTGFRGYLEKAWKFFPKEEEVFKKRHPWLYAKIKESF
jgi:hypothetical protein